MESEPNLLGWAYDNFMSLLSQNGIKVLRALRKGSQTHTPDAPLYDQEVCWYLTTPHFSGPCDWNHSMCWDIGGHLPLLSWLVRCRSYRLYFIFSLKIVGIWFYRLCIDIYWLSRLCIIITVFWGIQTNTFTSIYNSVVPGRVLLLHLISVALLI